MVRLLGDADRVKLPCGFTVTAIVVLATRLPDVPVTVTFAVPGGAVPLLASVTVLLPVVLAGLNEAVTPLGKPDAERLTDPVKPF